MQSPEHAVTRADVLWFLCCCFFILIMFLNAYLDLLIDFITHGTVMILDLETLLWGRHRVSASP